MSIKRIKKNTTRKQTKVKGGKVIGSGGFGCVFKPALKCVGQNKRRPNYVSKLMTKKHVKEEYEEITQIKNYLKRIPHYENYFMLTNISTCEPSALDQEDLYDFDNKCDLLSKEKIHSKNINDQSNLNKLSILNIPFGGVPIDEYIDHHFYPKELIHFNDTMIQLLTRGIIPMNKKNVYHNDIKSSNVLVDEKGTPRLIDWGLAVKYIPNDNESFPRIWRNRLLQFNAPFSMILFTDLFVAQYENYLLSGGRINAIELEPFVFKYVKEVLETVGLGHYGVIIEIMTLLYNFNNANYFATDFNKNELLASTESTVALPTIVNYLVTVLVHYTKFRKNGTLNLRVYLNTVFIHIIDVWGFLIAYLPILEMIVSKKRKHELTKAETNLFFVIKDIYTKYLFTPALKPYNMKELCDDLKVINTVF